MGARVLWLRDYPLRLDRSSRSKRGIEGLWMKGLRMGLLLVKPNLLGENRYFQR